MWYLPPPTTHPPGFDLTGVDFSLLHSWSEIHIGTMKIESGTSDFSPEGPKKAKCVERGTFQKIENYTSGPPNSSPGCSISPQRVRKKRVTLKGTHSKKLKNIPRDHQIQVEGVRFSPRGSEKRELCRKGDIQKNWKIYVKRLFKMRKGRLRKGRADFAEKR